VVVHLEWWDEEQKKWEAACQRVHGRSTTVGEAKRWHDAHEARWKALTPKQAAEVRRKQAAMSPEERERHDREFRDRMVAKPGPQK
jgi:hypothetical protein